MYKIGFSMNSKKMAFSLLMLFVSYSCLRAMEQMEQVEKGDMPTTPRSRSASRVDQLKPSQLNPEDPQSFLHEVDIEEAGLENYFTSQQKRQEKRRSQVMNNLKAAAIVMALRADKN